MIKEIMYCDRCGKICEEERYNKGFHIFHKKYFVTTNTNNYLDLCQKCYDKFADFMANKESNDGTSI